MELRVKELCKEKGLKMSDLADRMCINQANLMASIKGNPTLSRLKDIATALGVEITELFPGGEKAQTIDGFVDVGGESLRLRNADDWIAASGKVPGLLDFPLYSKASDFRQDLKKFVHSTLKDDAPADVFYGRLGSQEVFLMTSSGEQVSDGESGEIYNRTFVLHLLSRKDTATFELVEYLSPDGYDIDGPAGMIVTMRNEIEGCFGSADSADEYWD
jgi:Predicted transcriptional regulators